MQLIPKTFHQVWLGKEPLPEKFQKFQHTWRAHHPNWEIKIWNENNLNTIPGLNLDDLKLCKNYAEKSDFIRFFILQEYGGIYIDTDFECLKNIESLLVDVRCFLSDEKTTTGTSITNAILGAVPKHSFIKKVCSIFPDRLKKTKNWGKYSSYRRIGPFFLGKIYSQFSGKDKIKVFSYKYFCPIEPMYSTGKKLYFKKKDIRNAFGIHHYASSWTSPTAIIGRYIWNIPVIGKDMFNFLQKIKYDVLGKSLKKYKITNNVLEQLRNKDFDE